MPQISLSAAPRRAALSHAALLFAVVLVAGGCNEDATGPDPDEPVSLDVEIVVSGLSSPIFLTAPQGDDRLFVVERGGRIRIISGGTVLPTPFLNISSEVTAGGEQGLLGMAFHPDYATNGRFYVNYSDAGDGSTEVVRYNVSTDPNVADAASDALVISIAQPFSNHNGGMLAFGPDGYLYVGMGDGGSGGDPQNHGQRPETLLGSMLRLNVDGGSPYTIPANNPFVGHATARPETWAYGLRNPWRFSFDRVSGDLYIGDVGQGDREEIDFQPAASSGGENYGWRIMEGVNCYNPSTGCSQTGLRLPVHDYSQSGNGCAVTGGYVYRGSALPALVGRYFFADYCGTWVRSFVVTGGVLAGLQDHSADLGPISNISSFGEDGHGELYAVTLGGTIYRFVAPAP